MPVIIAIEALAFGRYPTLKVFAAVVLVCLGIALATATDGIRMPSLAGLLIGLAAVLVTAVYQIWAGSKQKELQVGSMQLLHQFSPMAAIMLAILVPVLEPQAVGLLQTTPNKLTLMNFDYTLSSVTAIVVSSILGLIVSISTFSLIGVTSSLTFNIVGHLKTVTILAGGCLLFGDTMSSSTVAGIIISLTGIMLYSHIQMTALVQSRPVT